MIDVNYLIDNIINNNILKYSIDSRVIKNYNFIIKIFEYKNNDEKIPLIDLKQCYDYLKKYYSISENEDIIVINRNNTNYDIEYLLFDYNGNQLNISLCPYETIINIPILNESFFKNEEIRNLYQKRIEF